MTNLHPDLPDPFPTVFDKLEPSDVRLAPFPHIVKENALDPVLCERLISTRLRHPDSNGGANRIGNNQRTAYGAHAMFTPEMIDDSWKAFARIHIRPEVTLRIAELFADQWPSHLPDIDWLRSARYGLLMHDGFGDADVLCDARLEMIGPSLGPPWSHRMGHVDTGNRLFSALYYLRADDDETTGGGLDLYRYRTAVPETVNVFELDAGQIEKVVTIPYRANTLVVFPNSPQAVHGSEPRGRSQRDRAYVFITAEVERDLF
jgi:hypothetical protein